MTTAVATATAITTPALATAQPTFLITAVCNFSSTASNDDKPPSSPKPANALEEEPPVKEAPPPPPGPTRPSTPPKVDVPKEVERPPSAHAPRDDEVPPSVDPRYVVDDIYSALPPSTFDGQGPSPMMKLIGEDGAKFPTPVSPNSMGKSMTLKGVVFDVNGDVKLLDHQFKRAQFCAENTLLPRDLTKIDSTLAEQHPAILVRERSLLINLSHIKALIRADSLILFSSNTSMDDGAEAYFQSQFVHELQGKLQAKDTLPFELRALEAMLISVVSALKSDLDDVKPEVERLLEAMDKGFDPEMLKALLLHGRSLNKLVQKVEAIRSTFTDVLHNDEDLAGMYLTAKAENRPHAASDHIDAELMLEHYLKLADEISSSLNTLSSNVVTTQNMMGIVLDTHRNKLIVYDLKANIATVAISTAAFVASVFGMNLPNNIDSMPGVFWIVTGGLLLSACAIYFMSVQRIRMLGHARGLLRGIHGPERDRRLMTGFGRDHHEARIAEREGR
ncbi:magnesium ion transporter [Irineochytrium annulatum]|nr:magnesium ion transporter [Irineochytrium annulatum]